MIFKPLFLSLRKTVFPVLLGVGATAGLAEEKLADPSKPFASPEQWIAGDAGAWEWKRDREEPWLRLVRQSEVSPPVRSPFNLIWFDGARWDGFELELEARLTTFDKGNNDLCIAFAGEGDRKFYYAHLGERADRVHHQIHVVNEADRTPVTTWRTEGTPWKEGEWHRIRVVHRPESGEITVRFDGELLLMAVDPTFQAGRIGLGSFDDTGDFRLLRISGTRIEEESNPPQPVE